ncbi:MAG: DUF6687 family protein [Bacteroidota bacterium]
MKFIPFSEAQSHQDVVVVDAYIQDKLNLSHWRGVELPPDLVADTSTEIVLRALEMNPEIADREYCTNNHFDIDGFLGVWALHNPILAMACKDLLISMARLADFREKYGDQKIASDALSMVCYLNTLESEMFYDPFEMEAAEAVVCLPKYAYFLERFSDYVASEITFITSEHMVAMSNQIKMETSGAVIKYPEIRLAVVKAPDLMHYYALFADTADVDMVLTMYPDNRYELEQKYTTWVQTSRKSLPRIELGKLAHIFNQLESDANNVWAGDHFTETGPLLRISKEKISRAARFKSPIIRKVFHSSIDPETFEKTVVDFLTKSYQGVQPKNSWTWEEVRKFNESIS